MRHSALFTCHFTFRVSCTGQVRPSPLCSSSAMGAAVKSSGEALAAAVPPPFLLKAFPPFANDCILLRAAAASLCLHFLPAVLARVL
jgi:hypothetical protein